jgi:hypothetical protein
MSTIGQTVKEWVDLRYPCTLDDLLELLHRCGIDPDHDHRTHLLVAAPRCDRCFGIGELHARPYAVECPRCDGRGWLMP